MGYPSIVGVSANVLFFFSSRRRHTRLVSDWSSDVCSSDLHRTVCAGLADLPKGVKVRAPKGADEWLSPDKVRMYWQDSLPLRNSRTAYLILPVGAYGIRSEERRVGKEGRSRGSQYREKQKR